MGSCEESSEMDGVAELGRKRSRTRREGSRCQAACTISLEWGILPESAHVGLPVGMPKTAGGWFAQ
jgi:hypothetical protein